MTVFDNWWQLTTIGDNFDNSTIAFAIQNDFDNWNWDTDTDNSDNWEHEFMTIFVNWQLIVTLDSIRNSCDVYFKIGWLWNLRKRLRRNFDLTPKTIAASLASRAWGPCKSANSFNIKIYWFDLLTDCVIWLSGSK